jgi:hypothetical protein
MQLGGDSVRVKLTVDLTRYDYRCVEGSLGSTIPNYKFGLYGSFDHFVAVRFDNGSAMDIAYSSLELLDDVTEKGEDDIKTQLKNVEGQINAINNQMIIIEDDFVTNKVSVEVFNRKYSGYKRDIGSLKEKYSSLKSKLKDYGDLHICE